MFGNVELLLLWKHCRKILSSLIGIRNSPHDREIEIRLQGIVNWKELWNLIIDDSKSLNVRGVYLNVNAPALNEGYHIWWDSDDAADEDQKDWRVEVPLFTDGHQIGQLLFVGVADETPHWEKMQLLADVLRQFERPLALLTSSSKNLLTVDAEVSEADDKASQAFNSAKVDPARITIRQRKVGNAAYAPGGSRP